MQVHTNRCISAKTTKKIVLLPVLLVKNKLVDSENQKKSKSYLEEMIYNPTDTREAPKSPQFF